MCCTRCFILANIGKTVGPEGGPRPTQGSLASVPRQPQGLCNTSAKADYLSVDCKYTERGKTGGIRLGTCSLAGGVACRAGGDERDKEGRWRNAAVTRSGIYKLSSGVMKS